MIARRDLLKSGAVLGAAAASVGAVYAPASAAAQPAFGFYDAHLADGQRFALLARQLGMESRETGRDMATILYGDMRDWAEHRDTLFMGLTRYADFTVASGIAREHGRSMVLAIQRRPSEGGLRWIHGDEKALEEVAATHRRQASFLRQPQRMLETPGTVLWAIA